MIFSVILNKHGIIHVVNIFQLRVPLPLPLKCGPFELPAILSPNALPKSLLAFMILKESLPTEKASEK